MLEKAIESGTAFAWHGGDISYSDDFFLGIIGNHMPLATM